MPRWVVSRAILAKWLAIVIIWTTAAPAFASIQPTVTAGTVTDVVVGRNNKGPYTLSWNNIDAGSVVVVLNGRTLKKGDNYAIDCAKGTLAFTTVLLNDALVRISYTTTAKSQQNSGKLNIPVTLDIFQRQDAALRVTGIYAQNDPNKPDSAKTVLGIGGEKSWKNSKLTSQMFVSQAGDADKGGAWDRSAFKVGSENTFGALKFTGSMLRVGSDFSGGTETGLGVGKEATDLALAFNPNAKVQAGVKFVTSEDTAGAAKGAKSSLQQQNVALAVSDTGNLALTHTQTTTSTAATGSERTVDSNVAEFTQKLNAQTSGKLTAQTATVTTDAATVKTQTQTAAVTAAKVSGEATFTQKQTQAQGGGVSAEDSMGISVSARPADKTKVDVKYGSLSNDTVGQQTSQSAAVEAAPIKVVTFRAALDTVDSTKLGKTTRSDITVQANPAKNLQFQSHLTGNVTDGSTQFQRDFSLTTSPLSYAKFSASLSQKGVNQDDYVTKAAALELTPNSLAKLSAGYKYVENGTSVLTIMDYAATAKPWKFFSVAGSLRDREVDNDCAPDSGAMQVALSPFDFFSLTGGYQTNPEDNKGVVQNYRASSVGIKARLGSVGVTTDYSSKDEYLADRLSDEARLALDLPVFGAGKLTTGAKFARALGGTAVSANTYSLGYQHGLNSRFNFSLTGYYTRYLREQAAMSQNHDYSAEASFGASF